LYVSPPKHFFLNTINEPVEHRSRCEQIKSKIINFLPSQIENTLILDLPPTIYVSGTKFCMAPTLTYQTLQRRKTI
jgi:hypothetical protein